MTTVAEMIAYLQQFNPTDTVWVLPQRPGASVQDIPEHIRKIDD